MKNKNATDDKNRLLEFTAHAARDKHHLLQAPKQLCAKRPFVSPKKKFKELG
jgi:hypothetical protein